MIVLYHTFVWRPSWSWSYGSWIFNYLCNQCLSQLMLWVRIRLTRVVVDASLWDKFVSDFWQVAGLLRFHAPI